MLKVRIIPVLTFNGFALVKTKQFQNPRMVGNPVQAARVFNSRGVDELIFLDIFASRQNRKINLKIVKDVIKECFMPVGIGGGIDSIKDIQNLLQIGADKVVIKNTAIKKPSFINSAANFFGSQCISISVDVIKKNDTYYIYNDLDKEISMVEFLKIMEDNGAGEIILNNVEKDGMMSGFDYESFNIARKNCQLPIVCLGGGGNLQHFVDLFDHTDCNAVGSSSIFHFSQFTPLDIKNSLNTIGLPVRII